ncbi:hypothetical protein [Streptomyces sp. CC224B]|nr:hypothetical protein [Streptomyces sp. CC224B]
MSRMPLHHSSRAQEQEPAAQFATQATGHRRYRRSFGDYAVLRPGAERVR